MSAGVEPASLDVFIETSTEPAATAQIVNPLTVMVKAPLPAICDVKECARSGCLVKVAELTLTRPLQDADGVPEFGKMPA
jgi:hypothetical protein